MCNIDLIIIGLELFGGNGLYQVDLLLSQFCSLPVTTKLSSNRKINSNNSLDLYFSIFHFILTSYSDSVNLCDSFFFRFLIFRVHIFPSSQLLSPSKQFLCFLFCEKNSKHFFKETKTEQHSRSKCKLVLKCKIPFLQKLYSELRLNN